MNSAEVSDIWQSVRDSQVNEEKYSILINYRRLQINLGHYKSFTPFLDGDVFSKTVDVNIKGAVYFVRAVTNAMAQEEPTSYTSHHGTRSLGRGSIVLLGSAQSYLCAPGMVSYTTGKHDIIGIMKSAGKYCSRFDRNSSC